MSAEQHRVEVDVWEGSVSFRIICPYDEADESRPCWPVDTENDDRPRLPAPQECNYESWADNMSSDELQEGSLSFTTGVEWEWKSWDGDPAMRLTTDVRDLAVRP